MVIIVSIVQHTYVLRKNHSNNNIIIIVYDDDDCNDSCIDDIIMYC